MNWIRRCKLLAAAIIAVSVMLTSMPQVAAAASPINIYVNSTKVSFSGVKPVSISSRVFVPVRALVETKLFGGKMTYSSATRKVTVKRGSTTVVVKIGSKTATRNGKSCKLSAAPVMKSGRALVPINSYCSLFGLSVCWDAGKRSETVIIPLTSKLEVMGYYYGSSYSDFSANYSKLTDVSCHWYSTNASGVLTKAEPSGYTTPLTMAANKKIRTQGSIALFDQTQLHSLLTSQTASQQLIAAAVQLAADRGFSDISIDFESIKPADKAVFNSFLSSLYTALKQHNVGLIVVVPAQAKAQSWNAAYDYATIAKYARRVVLMTYDYHWFGGPAGPIAPMDWVSGSVGYAKKYIPASKLLLGIGLYGYDWPGSGTATSLTYSQAAALAAKLKVTPSWNSTYGLHYFSYTKSKVKHQVWYEDADGVQLKLNLAKTQGLAGISIWRLGYGFPAFWTKVAAYR
jgi:spore germination protein